MPRHRINLLAALAVSATLAHAQAPSVLDTSGSNPLVEILRLRLAGRVEEAIARGETLRDQQPARSRQLGLDLALAASYEQGGRPHDAFDAWQRGLGSPTPLFARYAAARVAALHLQLDRPDSAAQVARRALASPSAWADEVVSTLVAAVETNRDCAVVAIDASWDLSQLDRRRLRLAEAECELDSRPDESVHRLTSLVIADQHDLVASQAAELLYPFRHDLSAAARRALAEALHHHRLFDRSTELLAELLDDADSAEERYKLARGHFWLGNYTAAADEFRHLASLARGANSTARGWFQRGRSLELAGEVDAALVAFRRAFDAAPTGPWASASLISALRLEVVAGNDAEARRLYSRLASRSGWRGLADRAALFLSSSDIVRGRTQHARGWLSRSSAPEFRYWKGRLAELEGRAGEAIDHYLALATDADHPLAEWAHARLRGDLAAAADARGRDLAASRRLRDLHSAALLFGGGDRGEALAARESAAARSLGELWGLTSTPVSSWPLWNQELSGDERLLRLGLVADDADVRRRFPLDDTPLAIGGIDVLYLNGLHRDGLRIAEVLAKKLRPRLDAAEGMTPPWLDRRLFPRPYLDHVNRAAANFDIDPNLLLGLIRQESRFDSSAVSAVSARGLTQFVVATAQEAASQAEIDGLRPAMLHRPEIAIDLAAVHLRHLGQQFNAMAPAVLAAYNAGLPQARIWAGYCLSDDPAEFFSKIGFTQTRDYVAKVLANRNRYRVLYGGPHPPSDGVTPDR